MLLLFAYFTNLFLYCFPGMLDSQLFLSGVDMMLSANKRKRLAKVLSMHGKATSGGAGTSTQPALDASNATSPTSHAQTYQHLHLHCLTLNFHPLKPSRSLFSSCYTNPYLTTPNRSYPLGRGQNFSFPSPPGQRQRGGDSSLR